MSVQDSDATMAVFLDLENIALGAHDADFPAFDIRKVLERLLLKGQIVVKKAYCDFENYKTVIGVGVKKSTSDLFISNCDEFIYYDDLVRVEPAKKRPSVAATAPAAKTGKDHRPSIDGALDLLRKTLEALRAERGEDYPIRGSLMKQAMKRQNPGFNERAHGFRAFNELLLEAQKRGLLKLERDKQVGTYIVHAIE